jgi:hypothetical protein
MDTTRLRQPVKELSTDVANEMLKTISVLQTAIELSQEEPPKHLHSSRGWMAGTTLWMRALKNCEATLFLTQQGMDGPAWSNLRAAYECLFFACALWEKPSNYARLADNHRKEKGKQARGLLKPGVSPNLSAARKASLEANASGDEKLKEWKAFDAAHEVGLDYFYEMVYRGSGAMGAHATALSADAHLEEVSKGVHTLYYGPRFDDAKFLNGWVQELLAVGLNALKKSHQPHPTPNPG